MQILNLRLVREAHQIVLSSRCKVRRVGLDDLIFKIPARFDDFIARDASPFAAALLLPCMKLGEDLFIRGAVSARLYQGMQDLVQMGPEWGIGLKPIRVEPDELVADAAGSAATGAFFSGGVDSFYTYLQHHDDADDRITHLILVNGYDIDPKNPGLWDATRRHVREIAEDDGATLIEIETNMRSLTDPILSWTYAFTGGLAAVALCLRGGLKHVYVPATYDTEHQLPWSTSDNVSFWGTETLAVSNDGSEASRLDKIDSQISKSSLALRHLRVCYSNQKGAYNCGVCEKCLRTMVSLYIAGALDKAETFPRHVDLSRLAAVQISNEADALFHESNLAALQARRLAPHLQAATQSALTRFKAEHRRRPLVRDVIRRIDYLDYRYARGTTRKLKARMTGRNF